MLTRLVPTKAKVNLKFFSHGVPHFPPMYLKKIACVSSCGWPLSVNQSLCQRHRCQLLQFGSSMNYLREVNVRFMLNLMSISANWQYLHLSPSQMASGLGNTAIESETACRSCYIYNATVYMHTCMQTY